MDIMKSMGAELNPLFLYNWYICDRANGGVMSCFWLGWSSSFLSPQQPFKMNVHYLLSLLYILKCGHVFRTGYTKEPVCIANLNVCVPKQPGIHNSEASKLIYVSTLKDCEWRYIYLVLVYSILMSKLFENKKEGSHVLRHINRLNV